MEYQLNKYTMNIFSYYFYGFILGSVFHEMQSHVIHSKVQRYLRLFGEGTRDLGPVFMGLGLTFTSKTVRAKKGKKLTFFKSRIQKKLI